MKTSFRLLTIILLLFTFSCSDDETLPEGDNIQEMELNIPTFLHGKWGVELKNIDDEIVSISPTFEMTKATMHSIQNNTAITRSALIN